MRRLRSHSYNWSVVCVHTFTPAVLEITAPASRHSEPRGVSWFKCFLKGCEVLKQRFNTSEQIKTSSSSQHVVEWVVIIYWLSTPFIDSSLFISVNNSSPELTTSNVSSDQQSKTPNIPRKAADCSIWSSRNELHLYLLQHYWCFYINASIITIHSYNIYFYAISYFSLWIFLLLGLQVYF